MHYKQNNKETRRYVQGLRPFVNTLPRQIKGVLKKKGYNYSEIINKWNIFAGNEASKYSIPKSIKTTINSSKKTLVIAVERGNEIVLEYSKEDIINWTIKIHNLVNQKIFKPTFTFDHIVRK